MGSTFYTVGLYVGFVLIVAIVAIVVAGAIARRLWIDYFKSEIELIVKDQSNQKNIGKLGDEILNTKSINLEDKNLLLKQLLHAKEKIKPTVHSIPRKKFCAKPMGEMCMGNETQARCGTCHHWI